MGHDRQDGVLIVGGVGGLGAAAARAFAAEGRDVVVTYRARKDAAQGLVDELETAGITASAVCFDLTRDDPTTLVSDVERDLGGLGALVYAAGGLIPQRYVAGVDSTDWRRVVDMDLHGFLALVQAAIPALRRSQGALVAVTTTGVRRHPARDILSTAPKAAVEAIVRGVAREEGRFGVRANCVAPGMMQAGVGAQILAEEPEDVAAAILATIPLRRFGVAEEAAAAIAFLASSRASYISGQVLAVDGGWQV